MIARIPRAPALQIEASTRRAALGGRFVFWDVGGARHTSTEL